MILMAPSSSESMGQISLPSLPSLCQSWHSSDPCWLVVSKACLQFELPSSVGPLTMDSESFGDEMNLTLKPRIGPLFMITCHSGIVKGALALRSEDLGSNPPSETSGELFHFLGA